MVDAFIIGFIVIICACQSGLCNRCFYNGETLVKGSGRNTFIILNDTRHRIDPSELRKKCQREISVQHWADDKILALKLGPEFELAQDLFEKEYYLKLSRSNNKFSIFLLCDSICVRIYTEGLIPLLNCHIRDPKVVRKTETVFYSGEFGLDKIIIKSTLK